MSLNLGNAMKAMSDDMSFEDAYIEWMEADQQFMNIMNAIEISEKAKASQSAECIRFAEELLGCSLEDFEASMEVQYRPQADEEGEYWGHVKQAGDEAEQALIRTTQALLRKLNAIRSYGKNLDKKKVYVPGIIIKYAHWRPNIKKDADGSTHHASITNVSVNMPERTDLRTAIEYYIQALLQVKKVFTTATTHKYQTSSIYKTERNQTAKILKLTKDFVRKY